MIPATEGPTLSQVSCAFDPDLHPVELLGPTYRGSTAETELVTWREGFEWLQIAGTNEWWDKVSSSFAAKMLLFSECRRDHLRSTLGAVSPGDRVLDVACGPGSTSRLLAECGAAEVVGLDADESVLELAAAAPVDGVVAFQAVDARGELPFDDNSFDAAHLADFYDLSPLDEMRRVVRPGGRIIVRATNIAVGRIYGHDLAFDARLHAAAEQGLAERFGPAVLGQPSWYGQLRSAGMATPTTIAIDWCAPLEPLVACWHLHSAALWVAGHARSFLGAEDWGWFVELWDPDNPEALLHRDDAHIIQAVSWSSTVV